MLYSTHIYTRNEECTRVFMSLCGVLKVCRLVLTAGSKEKKKNVIPRSLCVSLVIIMLPLMVYEVADF